MYKSLVQIVTLCVIHKSASDARQHFFELMDKVSNDHYIVLVNRRDGENVAMIAESDLSSLMETVYLLRSPKNARRLFEAIERSKERDGKPLEHKKTEEAIADLKKELGIVEEEI